jgi:tetratricopeptide (TPR) repeat protein
MRPPGSRPTAGGPHAGPNALAQQLQAAFALQAEGRLEEAEAAAKRILKLAPKEPNTLYLLGIIAHQRGDTKAAAQHFEKSYKADRRSVAALSGLGIVRLDQKRYGEARELFRKALTLQQGDAMLLNNLGLAEKGAGDLAKAADCFRKALAAGGGTRLPARALARARDGGAA